MPARPAESILGITGERVPRNVARQRSGLRCGVCAGEAQSDCCQIARVISFARTHQNGDKVRYVSRKICCCQIQMACNVACASCTARWNAVIASSSLQLTSNYPVASASRYRLWLRSLAPRICSYSVDLRPVPKPRRV